MQGKEDPKPVIADPKPVVVDPKPVVADPKPADVPKSDPAEKPATVVPGTAPAAPPATPAETPEKANEKDEKEEDKYANTEQMKDFLQNLEKYTKDPRAKEQIKKMKERAPLYDKHQFWDTQPVPHMSKGPAKQPAEGVIENKTITDVRPTAIVLPEGFEWSVIDVTVDKEMEEVFELLRDNYVEDSDKMFRFKYSIPFIRWALNPPGYIKDWILGVRVMKNKKLVGFISGIPSKVTVSGKAMPMAEINFLCVHKKLRSKRLAPVLIKEITRRINMKQVWQAIYTAGKFIPSPISECLYFHRSLNAKKLIEIGFSYLPPKSTIKRQERIHKLPEETDIVGLRKMVKKDAKQVHKLLLEYLKRFKIYVEMTKKEVEHFLIPRDGVVETFVVEENAGPTGKEKIITDFFSFYTLSSSVLKHSTITEMKASYVYYYATTKTPLEKLFRNAMILAKKADHDVFNCLNVMDNKTVTDELLFGQGNGNLMYYLYNYSIPSIKPEELGVVLVQKENNKLEFW